MQETPAQQPDAQWTILQKFLSAEKQGGGI